MPRSSQRGAVLLMAIILILAVSLIAALVIKYAGTDMTEAAQMGVKERGRICAEAGIQYGRRFFGSRYETSRNWNDYLDGTSPLFRFDPDNSFKWSVYASWPKATLGMSDGTSFDPGADLDNDGQPDFWVSIRDDDDERPLGIAADDPTRDNNETVILRSECINDSWASEIGGVKQHAVIEAVLTHVQGGSGYGNAQITSNSPDIVGQPAK